MNIKVNDRSLYITEDETLVAGSVLEYTVNFSFSDAWEGYTKTAVFKTQAGAIKTVMVSEDAAVIPSEALAEAQYIRIGIYGEKGSQRRPTLWSEMKYVEPGTELTGQTPTPSPVGGQFVLDQCVLA